MAELVGSGRIVDLILLGIAAEAVALWIYGRRTGRAGGVLLNLLAGAALLLALRAALTGAAWYWIPVWLALSLPAHAADLWYRLSVRRSET